MNSKIKQPWFPLQRIEELAQLEPALIVVGLALISWVIYKIFLREASKERHRNLQKLFLNMGAHLAVFIVLFVAYYFSQQLLESGEGNDRVTSYFGLATLVAGAIVFVKTSRILLFEYLFLGHMKEGVPVLLVNLLTLILSIGIVAWFATDVFSFRLAPLLATSAFFSVVLGLALQDTLGNLFAGVALQFDKPYEIGDWIEVQSAGQKWVGQVHEITWRATTLTGLFDEALIIPNRVVSQAEVSNFSSTGLPIWRSQNFKIPYGPDIQQVKEILLQALKKVNGIRQNPEPIVLIPESSESWLLFRCSYCIDDYGNQWKIGTEVITSVINALHGAGQSVAAARLQVISLK